MAPADSQHQLLLSALEKLDFGKSLWSSKLQMKKTKCRRVSMKRKARLDRRIKRRKTIERKVRTLKKLIPNCEQMGAERLFMEAADYIVALQIRVKLMQVMVDVLSSCDNDNEEED